MVTREQLIARLWPKGVVEFDTGLNTAMRKLRIALGDDADTPRYIETIPRKGYRFIGTLEPDPAASLPTLPGAIRARPRLKRAPSSGGAPPTAARPSSAWPGASAASWRRSCSRWSPGACPASCSRAKRTRKRLPTIVVLPLVDMSVEQNEQALCDGLTEELSNWLAHIPTLRVVARTSAFAFKGTNTDVREIARQLGATHVLEGSLRRSGDQMRITIQLIEATGGLHIWSRSFDLPIGDIFLIEDTVSRSVAEALHLTLSADDGRAMGAAPAGEDGGVRAVPAGPRAPAQAHRRGQSQGRGILPARGGRRSAIRAGARGAWRRPC